MDRHRPPFPPELVEQIVNLLVERDELGALKLDSKESLKQCALVNWVFLSSSRPRLFHHVTLPSKRHYRSMSNTLRSYPHIAGLIHSLHAHCQDDLTAQEIDQYNILYQCSNLTQLFMEKRIRSVSALEFYGRLLALPDLRRVGLIKMSSFPFRVLSGCVALESLAFYRCGEVDFSPGNKLQQQGARMPCMVPQELVLSEFTLAVEGHCLEAFTKRILSPASFLRFHNLRTLAAVPVLPIFTEGVVQSVQRLIDVARNIEYLILNTDHLALRLDFTPLTRLLHLRLDLFGVEGDGSISVDYLPRILLSASDTLPSLEVLTVRCNDRDGSKEWPSKLATRERWKQIDDAFREVHAKFPALRRVSIEVLLHQSQTDPSGFMKEELSYLQSKRGLLKLTYTRY